MFNFSIQIKWTCPGYHRFWTGISLGSVIKDCFLNKLWGCCADPLLHVNWPRSTLGLHHPGAVANPGLYSEAHDEGCSPPSQSPVVEYWLTVYFGCLGMLSCINYHTIRTLLPKIKSPSKQTKNPPKLVKPGMNGWMCATYLHLSYHHKFKPYKWVFLFFLWIAVQPSRKCSWEYNKKKCLALPSGFWRWNYRSLSLIWGCYFKIVFPCLWACV
jgi:hypothetical protein